ncbi:MAG: bifunctional methylenetetrahydrofolate dehydrogenase/methenyltetrahydrofolate cyclohydrolase FolD [Firmicutes bacterium]|nr:bifunctional methylenetetrahydrofolate dehydrogenase/methenyltetrahydrofolate cyclohydrolase FolD [Bacillota bacterium]
MGGARTLDGKAVAARVQEEIRQRIAARAARDGQRPGLAVVQVGEDPASSVYVRNKRRTAERLGMRSREMHLPADAGTEAVLAAVADLAADDAVHGILVQLPLPPAVDVEAVLAAIPPDKDVDGLTVTNLGRLLAGRPGLVPCTPAGIMTLLGAYGITLDGARAVVIGRSRLVGLPVALLLQQANATVTVVHTHTRDAARLAREAEVLVVAAGRPQLVTAEWVRPGAVVVDVGIHRQGERLVGDVEAASVARVAGYLSPVPGGVGPMTIASLMANTWQAFTEQVPPPEEP